MKKTTILTAVLFLSISLSSLYSNEEWRHPLYMSGGGIWSNRNRILLQNDSPDHLKGQIVSLKIGTGKNELDLVERPLREVRITDSEGKELLFLLQFQNKIWGDSNANTPIPRGATLYFPAFVPAKGKSEIFIYYGNKEAYPVPEMLTSDQIKKAGNKSLNITVIKKETLSLRTLNRPVPWELSSKEWPVRIPINCRNVSDREIPSMLFSIPARFVTRANYRIQDMCLMFQNEKITLFKIGGNMIFELKNVSPKSEIQGSLYLRADRKNQMVSGKMADSKISSIHDLQAESSGGSLLSDYQFSETEEITPSEYKKLLYSEANLLKDILFQGKDKAWNYPAPDKKSPVSFEFIPSELFDGNMARITINANAPRNWYEFRQTVTPLSPHSCYIMAAWSRSRPTKDGVFEQYMYAGGRIQAHLFRKSMPGQRMYPGPSIPHDGKNKWALDSKLFRDMTGSNDIVFEYHLVVDAKGVFEYDGVLLAKVFNADTLPKEYAPDREVSSLTVWGVPSVIKIFKDDVPEKSNSDLRIVMARNESENLQIGIRDTLTDGVYELNASAPANHNGKTLGKPKIYVIGYVKVDTDPDYLTIPRFSEFHRLIPPNSHFSGTLYPDPMLPINRIDLKKKSTSSAILEFRTDKNTAPGLYVGHIELVRNGNTALRVPYYVDVKNFALSDTPKVTAGFPQCNGGYVYMWRWNGGKGTPDIRTFTMNKRIAPMYLPGYWGMFSLKDGKIKVDFSKFDKGAEEYFNQYGFPFAYAPPEFSDRASNHAIFRQEKRNHHSQPLTKEYKENFREALEIFQDHVRRKGWSDRFLYYLKDEPNSMNKEVVNRLAELCDLVHSVDPTLKTYASTWCYIPDCEQKLNLWGFGMQGSASIDRMKKCVKSGNGILFTTDGHLVLGTPYCASERMLPYLSWKYRTIGYEFWNVDFYSLNPFEWGFHGKECTGPAKNLGKSTSVIRWTSGDGYMIYPGNMIGRPGEIINSIRFDNVRDGVDDHEYYTLLEELAEKTKDPKALNTLKRLRELLDIPNCGGRDSVLLLPDPYGFVALREEIATQIERLSGEEKTSAHHHKGISK